eukprot:CAMPEP_0197185112 /NCGR_PEP_ID=MMETSP1423-20130617/11177_1 /TAXON_ID=476441 /ORGANISM="Pseudo-nitzschia heimii, Strain UNC1101" /LENGTH=511 /DNA_ID=CAMNT_0042636081 /DNA_START=149 /DNA_END=1684 /DNA_ORIENTATION=+
MTASSENDSGSDSELDYSSVEWPTDPSQFSLKTKIGHGAFAKVWRASTTISMHCKSNDDNENNEEIHEEAERRLVSMECAIKVLNLDHVDSNLDEIRLEVQAMRLSSHPNVLSCFATFVHSRDLWLVTQLMRKGSSLHCLQRARRRAAASCNEGTHVDGSTGVPIKMENHILYIMHETLLGLQYIHEHNGQIHRDIKAGNILIDSNGDVRIADFGVSGWLVNEGTQQEKAKTFVGTPCWMAPEVMEQINGYDYKADIWSLGITAMELAKGYAPYAKFPPMKVLILTIQEDPPSLDTYDEDDSDEIDDWLEYYDDEVFSNSFRSFVDACLRKDPAKRPTTSDLLQCKPISDYEDPVYRGKRRRAIVDEVCNLVDDVGSSEPEVEGSNDTDRNLPGHSPVSIIFSKEEENRPAGTTWVFADGSQLLSSSATNIASVDDVLDEIDQFGLQTGGEHYSRAETFQQHQQNTLPSQNQSTAIQQQEDEEGDDLNAFMDEFEMNTQGENFRRPSKEAE